MAFDSYNDEGGILVDELVAFVFRPEGSEDEQKMRVLTVPVVEDGCFTPNRTIQIAINTSFGANKYGYTIDGYRYRDDGYAVTGGGFVSKTVNVTDSTPGAAICGEDGVIISNVELTITEGSTGTYSVTLNTKPDSEVTIEISVSEDAGITLSNDGDMNPGSTVTLTFTPDNWDVPQEITITADEDNTDFDDEMFTIGHTVTSTDSDYDGVDVADVKVTVTDNDAPPGVTVSHSSMTVPEGQSRTYTVKLNSLPTSDVVIDINAGEDLEITKDGDPITSLTFTQTDGTTAQTVTVTAGQDSDSSDENRTISHTIDSSSATEYQGLTVDDIAVRIDDDDPPPNNPARGAPTISGTPQVGQTLTAGTTGISDPDGINRSTLTYQWIRDTTDIPGATGSSYTLTSDDEGGMSFFLHCDIT